MIVTLHTPDGPIEHELTPQELEQWAALGDNLARAELASQEMPAHSDPHLKIDLLSWAMGIIDARPALPGPP